MILTLRESQTRCPAWLKSASPAAVRTAVIAGCAAVWAAVILIAVF